MGMKKMKLIEPVVDEEEIRNVTKVLRSGWLTEGPVTKQFEEEVRQYVGAKHSVATTSCTTALELSLRALGIGPGDEVIVPDFTHPATANIVEWIGAKPVLVDVDLFSYNIDPAEVRKAITKKTKCIIPVSWGGNPLDMKPLNDLKEEHGLAVVEDAACSLGAEFDGKKTGTMADITCFSFHPRKIVTSGEGGMAVTDDRALAEKISSMKNFGMRIEDGKRMFIQLGTNYKLSDVLSAIGLVQMTKIEKMIRRRIELANYYDKLLVGNDLITPPERRENTRHTCQTYSVYVHKERARDKIIEDLRKASIETQIGTYALHMQPSCKEARRVGRLERAEELYMNLLALPLSHFMSSKDQELVISQIEKSLHAS
jgi:dTDP-4-amino-4,6-dideoxygalactose transaminase